MAESVITLDKKQKKETRAARVEQFLIRNRIPLLSIVAVLAGIAVLVCVVVGISESVRKKGVAAVESIEYTFTRNSESLTADELAQRQDAAIEALQAYLGKGGIVGARAAMLAADIYGQKQDWEKGLEYWLQAAAKSEKNYLAPICYFNAGVCGEELGRNAEAASYYETAAGKEDFYLVTHALFSLGRVRESLGDYQKAGEAYRKIIDSYATDAYADIAQSRIIALQADGKID